MTSVLEKRLMALSDAWVHRSCRRNPTPDQWRRCRLVAHRGDWDHGRLMENTLPAFDRALAAGVWGVELDLRWTRDHHPVVVHDSDLRRLFQCSQSIADLDLAEIRRRFPVIPTFSEVIARYGKRLHLMVEIKDAPHVLWARKSRILGETLYPLQPGRDYHILALDLPPLRALGQVPARALLPIARFNTVGFSREVIQNNYGGLCGHYLLMTRRLTARHARQGQGVGVGYADSWTLLCRAVSRNVTWIFSNRAVELEACRRTHLSRLGPGSE